MSLLKLGLLEFVRRGSWINLVEKAVRAEVIRDYLAARGENRCVCFSSGNAALFLREVGLQVIEVGPRGLLGANRWLSFNEIAFNFPGLFDATSGHLPWPLMVDIANRIRGVVGSKYRPGGVYTINSGSGETVVVLALAFPKSRFIAKYNVRGLKRQTQYSSEAPLNSLVERLAYKVVK